jgi:hypothetical protein
MTIITTPRTAARGLRWTALLLSIVQLLSPAVLPKVFRYGDFLSTGSYNEAAITPATYAFGIWGVITLLCTASCIGILRYGLGSPWEPRLLIDASVVFIGFTAWLLIAARDLLWATVAVFAVMVLALIDIMRLLVRHADDLATPTWLRQLATACFGLYLGWGSVAVFVNIAAALVKDGLPASGTGWQTIVLVIASLAAVTLTVFLGSTPGYVAAALWALIAAAIGAAQRGATTLALVSAAGALVVLASAVIRRRSLVGRDAA